MKEKENEVIDFSKLEAKIKSEPRGLGIKGISKERLESKTEMEKIISITKVSELTGIKYHRLKAALHTNNYIRLTVTEIEELSKVINRTLVALCKKFASIQ